MSGPHHTSTATTPARRLRYGGLLALAAALLLAGCAAPASDPGRPDPAGDRIGWEDGYWYDDPLHITPEDGLNASEREAVTARMMARIEHIRSLEFDRPVNVTVINRSQYIQRRAGGGGGDGNKSTHELWNDQVWEGLFLVGESSGFSSESNETLSVAVQGFYAPGKEQIVIVSDNPTPALRRGTLVHELVHALQDQQFGLGYPARTQDQQLAGQSVIEGEANALQARYQQRCGTPAWDCYEAPEQPATDGGGGDGGGANEGILQVLLAPYASGPTFVETIHARGGWPAVNALYEDFPASSEQVIHPELYPHEMPVNVTVENRSSAGWTRFDHDPVADTVGEASIFAMLYQNGATEPGLYRYGYRAPASAGWAGDSLVPYRNGDEYGYVFKTVWENRSEATQFLRAYHTLLRKNDADFRDRDRGVWVIEEPSDFADAFRVIRRGDAVIVVNGPTVGDLDDIHPPV